MSNGNLNRKSVMLLSSIKCEANKQSKTNLLTHSHISSYLTLFIYLSSHPRCHLHTEPESHSYSPKGVRQSTTHPGGKKGRKTASERKVRFLCKLRWKGLWVKPERERVEKSKWRKSWAVHLDRSFFSVTLFTTMVPAFHTENLNKTKNAVLTKGHLCS